MVRTTATVDLISKKNRNKNKEVKVSIRKDRRKWIEDLVGKTQKAADTNTSM